MKTGVLTIDGKEYKLAITLRTHVIYERITGKMVSGQMSTFENIVFIYAVLMSQNREDFKMAFEGFFDWIDSHEEAYAEFFRWVKQQTEAESVLNNQDEDGVKKKV